MIFEGMEDIKIFSDENGIKRNCCPICGGQIIVSCFYQYSLDYKILKNSQMSMKYKKQGCGSIDCANASCSKCGECWGADEFRLEDNCFIDLKHTDCED